MIALPNIRHRGLLRVVIDACVLANYAVANLLLTLAEAGVILPLWSERILAETYRTHTGPRLGWYPRIARGFQEALLHNFPASVLGDYERWISQCTNHEKDRHVLACAIAGVAGVIVTHNLRDFGEKHLVPWGLCALHPQGYLLELHKLFHRQVLSALKKIARETSHKLGREVTVEEELEALAPFVPEFSGTMLSALGYKKS